jgi:hypothetical protein
LEEEDAKEEVTRCCIRQIDNASSKGRDGWLIEDEEKEEGGTREVSNRKERDTQESCRELVVQVVVEVVVIALRNCLGKPVMADGLIEQLLYLIALTTY